MSLKVDILCSGLGRVRRGYESFASECFDALRTHPALDLQLFGSRGAAALGGHELFCLPQTNAAAKLLGALCLRNPYFGEQASFVMSYLPRVIQGAPEVIFSSDRGILDLLWLLRRSLGFRYRLLASNGGPMGPPFTRTDFGQHLVDSSYEQSLRLREPRGRLALLPYGFDIPPHLKPMGLDERRRRRVAMRLPTGRPIVIVSGAVIMTHKRVDYIVREIASLPDSVQHPRPFLLLLGQEERETEAVRKLAAALLGPDGFAIRTVEAAMVSEYYAVSDVFALGSLREGFGRVLVEACAAGLPCIVNDEPNFRFILGEHGHYTNLQEEGAVSAILPRALSSASDVDVQCQRHAWAFERFSWSVLTPRYVDMFERCARVPMTTTVQMRGDTSGKADGDMVAAPRP